MSEPLSYKDLERQVKDLIAEKLLLRQEISLKEHQMTALEDFYKSVINSSDSAMVIVQGEYFRYINELAVQLFELQENIHETYKISDFIHPDFKGQFIKWVTDILNGLQILPRQEFNIKTLKSRVLKCSIYCRKINGNSNQNLLMFQIEKITDTEKNRVIAEKVAEGDSIFEPILTEGTLLLNKIDPVETSLFQYKIEKSNQAAQKILGREMNQIQNQLLGDIMFPDFVFHLPEQFENEYNEEFELYIKNLRKYIKFNILAINSQQIACKITDITDCYLTKVELNRNLQRNELFSEILNIYNTDKPYVDKFKLVIDRIVYHFKPKRILVFNNSADQKRGELFIQYVNNEAEPFPDNFFVAFDKVPSWNKLLNDRKMILGFTLHYLPEDLQDFFKELRIRSAYIFPIFIDNKLFGSILFENLDKVEWDNNEINYLKMVSVLITNLTSRQNYEEKLLKSKEKAEEADRLKSSFLANMSHDIRIPMTAIIGFSDLLADPDLTLGEREEFIELISKSGHDLLTLVDNIVDVAKIETGQLRINKESCNLQTIFKELHSEHNRDSKLVEHDDLELIIESDQEYGSIQFETDIFRLKQVFSNLIDNAIKFTDRGAIKFGVNNIWSDTIEFYVQDSGIGIAEETQHIIFERFSKIDRTYTREYNGTGLGLAICKSLVELMGGEIRVISYPGKGSTFYFTHPLPKTNQNQVAKNKNSLDVYHSIYEGKTILIAEDVEQNYRFLEFLLEPTKAKIIWAKNGKEAVDFVKAEPSIDLVLMDIRMPIMNGIDATKEILRIKKIPIIAQTAYTLGDEKEMALNAGCIDYLSKPINITNLHEVLKNIFFESEKVE